MNPSKLIDKWRVVIDHYKQQTFDWPISKWDEAKEYHMAIIAESAHKILSMELRPSQLSFEQPDPQKIFHDCCEKNLKIYDMQYAAINPAPIEDPAPNHEELVASVMSDISDELIYANDKRGTEFDDNNTLNDWVTYICMYASDAAKKTANPTEQRSKLYKAAGLCISALATLKRNDKFAERHYEDAVQK